MAKDEPKYTASDVRDAAGMSYRQLNDWEKKGAIPSERAESGSWRKFTAREVFAIMVCKEIRDRFGVPIESLRWIREFMLQDGVDHFRWAVEKIVRHNMSVFLLTDLKSSFVMDPDIEFADLIQLGYFRHEDPEAFVFLKVNPIAKRLVEKLQPELAKKMTIEDKYYDVVRRARAEPRNRKELELFRLLQRGNAEEVKVHFKNGEVDRVEVVESLDPKEPVEEKEFETITTIRRDGRTVRILRNQSIKLKDPRDEEGNPILVIDRVSV